MPPPAIRPLPQQFLCLPLTLRQKPFRAASPRDTRLLYIISTPSDAAMLQRGKNGYRHAPCTTVKHRQACVLTVRKPLSASPRARQARLLVGFLFVSFPAFASRGQCISDSGSGQLWSQQIQILLNMPVLRARSRPIAALQQAIAKSEIARGRYSVVACSSISFSSRPKSQRTQHHRGHFLPPAPPCCCHMIKTFHP